MAKRISTEAKLIEWVGTAPLDAVLSIMGIANHMVKQRVKGMNPAPAARAKRKANSHEAAASPATSFPGATGASA